MIQKLMGMIKRCVLTRSIDDSSLNKFPIVQCKYNEKACDVEFVSPWGLYTSPPSDGSVLGIVFNIAGQEENRSAFFYSPFTRILTDQPAQAIFGNPISKSCIKANSNGDVIEIINKDITITIKVNESKTIGGNSSVDVVGTYSITADSNITIKSSTKVSVIAPDIELGDGIALSDVLVQQAKLAAKYDTHVHPDPVSGNTGVPTVPLGSVSTSVVKGA